MAFLQDANSLLIDVDGNVAYLQDSALWEYDATDTTSVYGQVSYAENDLGEPSIDKLLNFVDVDYEGTFTLSILTDNITLTTLIFTDKATRGTVWRSIPLTDRKPFQKLEMWASSFTSDTKIYSIEIDFDVLKRRRYN